MIPLFVKNAIKTIWRDVSVRSETAGRMTMLDLAARFVHVGKVRGAYLEFGVYRGFTFSSAYKSFRRHNSSISHMWAFDSFDGMPAHTGVDQGAGSFEQAGQFRCSEEEFVRQLDGYRVPRSDYAVIPGWFDETLTADLAKKVGPAAVVWVDCDLYSSTVPVLRFIAPLIQNGTLLVFDDYYCFGGRADLGERRALEEFLESNQELSVTDYAKYGSTGQAFIVNFRR